MTGNELIRQGAALPAEQLPQWYFSLDADAQEHSLAALTNAIDSLVQAFEPMIEAVMAAVDQLSQIAEALTRSLFEQYLLCKNVPAQLSNWIARNIPLKFIPTDAVWRWLEILTTSPPD